MWWALALTLALTLTLTLSQVSAACGGPHYTDCAIQPQSSGCNAHFDNSSFHQVYG